MKINDLSTTTALQICLFTGLIKLGGRNYQKLERVKEVAKYQKD